MFFCLSLCSGGTVATVLSRGLGWLGIRGEARRVCGWGRGRGTGEAGNSCSRRWACPPSGVGLGGRSCVLSFFALCGRLPSLLLTSGGGASTEHQLLASGCCAPLPRRDKMLSPHPGGIQPTEGWEPQTLGLARKQVGGKGNSSLPRQVPCSPIYAQREALALRAWGSASRHTTDKEGWGVEHPCTARVLVGLED